MPPLTRYLLVGVSVFMLVEGCIKEDFNDLPFVVAVTGGTNPEGVDAIRLFGRLDGLDGPASASGIQPQEYGFVYSDTSDDPTLNSPDTKKIMVGTELNSNLDFNSLLTSLSVLKQYYFRAYAILGKRTSYGDVAFFSLDQNLKVELLDAVEVDNDLATLTGRLGLNFFGDLADYGFVYSATNQNPDIGRDSVISLGSPFGEGAPIGFDGYYTEKTRSLEFNTTYRVRAFAKINDDVVYSNLVEFTTRDGWKKLVTPTDILPIYDPAGVSNGAFGYIGLGCDQDCQPGNTANRIWEFSPFVNPASWTEKNRGDFSGRDGAISFAIGDKIYYGLGEAGGGYFFRLWEFDPNGGGAWIRMDDFPGDLRQDAVSFTLGGKGYVGTGLYSDENSPEPDYYDDFWVFDPNESAGKQWDKVPGALPLRFEGEDLPAGRSAAIAFTIGDKAYVGAGQVAGDGFTDLWEFIPGTGSWIFHDELPFSPALAFAVGDKAYLLAPDLAVVEYDPGTGSRTPRTSLPRETVLSFAFTLKGKGYVGGPNFKLNTIDVWEYTPAK